MKKTAFFILILVFGMTQIELFAQNKDWRDIRNGVAEIPDEGYCDQPYVVKTGTGKWLCVLTTGPGTESQAGQHIVASISSDQGKTWSELIDIEPSSDVISSWATPYVTPYGRIYVFYNYNGNHIASIKGKPISNAALLGWYCYKYSDDEGKSWSARFRLPLQKTAVDFINDWNGEVQHFWGISKPVNVHGSMYFAFTKMGKYHQELGEGWFFKSDNINEERDVEKLSWVSLPDGEQGLSTAALGSVQEEHNLVGLNNGDLYCVLRTGEGFPAHSYSRDGGRNWDRPVYMTYAADGDEMKNPRACPRVFKCDNGKYLLWYHNHQKVDHWQYRNPAWISGGIEIDGVINWSQPEILLYATDTTERMSYPDLVEENGEYWITETQKEVARLHVIDPALLEGMWSQGQRNNIISKGLLPTGYKPGNRSVVLSEEHRVGPEEGFSIDLWLETDELIPNQVIFDNRNESGNGFWLTVSDQHTLKLFLSKGQTIQGWDTDPGSLKMGQLQHVVFIVDGMAGIMTTVVNGKLCDGGRYRPFGWAWLKTALRTPSRNNEIRISEAWADRIKNIRFYNRYLTTSEAISNYRSGLN